MTEFDRRLQGMQRLLADVASQTTAIKSAQGKREAGARSPQAPPAARTIALSADDMDRLERLLQRLEARDGSHDRTGDAGRSERQSGGDRPLRRAWRRRSLTRHGQSGELRSRDRSRLQRASNDGAPGQRTSTDADDDWAETDSGLHLVDDTDAAEGDPRAKRFYLDIDDEIVRSPSIGQRTAERLAPHGIERVRDLIAADAADLAERINARHITAARIEDWQMQARLVCTVPWLRGTHAQLLVGAGYTTPGDINEADTDTLCADILCFAGTRDGQRVLRAGPPPEIEKIVKWVEFAAEAELDRAA